MSVAVQFEGLKRRFGRSVRVGTALVVALAIGGCSSGASRFDSLAGRASHDAPNDDKIVTASLPPVPAEPIYKDGAPPAQYTTVAKKRPAPPPPVARRPRTARAAPAPVARSPLPPAPRSRAASTKRITIRRGDTLNKLSRKHGVPVARIMAANDMSDTRLRAGQTIVLPGGAAKVARAKAAPRTHTVRPGDSIYVIARRHGVAYQALARHNGLTKPDNIRPGQVLKIPGRGSVAQPVRVAVAKRSPARKAVPAAKANAGRSTAVRVVQTKKIPAPRKHAAAGPKRPGASNGSTRSRVAGKTVRPTKPARRSKTRTSQSRKGKASRPLPKPKPMTGNEFRWPVRGRVISGYGAKPNGAHNDGINVAVPRGTSVKAAENGVVAYAGSELKGYGNLILVRHANNWVTAYAHNDKLMVKRGDSVRRGQIIAKAGKTGSVSQPQLHFELRRGSRPVDPLKHMAQS